MYSRTWDTKLYKIMENYWIMKEMVAHALEKCKEDHKFILHIVRIFECKFEVM